jgi:thiol-disulfide isomerase/thioredoxin
MTETLFGRLRTAGSLPVEGRVPGFEGATGWLNSAPQTSAGLHGKVVLVNFWTYTCINWLRTLPYVRAWAEKYRELGLVVIGVHTPEFPFERELENVRRAADDMGVTYPVALDSDYAVWRSFANQYWPATYIADTEGQIRHHQFGEGGYAECEMAIQRLLREAGSPDPADDVVSVRGERLEAQADWANLESPETYLGYDQGRSFSSPGRPSLDESQAYAAPESLELNHWALSGNWTIERRACVVDRADGRLAFRFHARDVNLVLRSRSPETTVPFSVLLDGGAPGASHGLDVDEQGRGTLVEPRLYNLIRQPEQIADRTFEIAFLAPGAEAYVFTFG